MKEPNIVLLWVLTVWPYVFTVFFVALVMSLFGPGGLQMDASKPSVAAMEFTSINFDDSTIRP